MLTKMEISPTKSGIWNTKLRNKPVTLPIGCSDSPASADVLSIMEAF